VNKPTDITVRETELFFLPTHLRVPLKFGAQVVTGAVCARVRVRVEDRQGRSAEGWGETPLSVAWVWPSTLTWEEREERMSAFSRRLAEALPPDSSPTVLSSRTELGCGDLLGMDC